MSNAMISLNSNTCQGRVDIGVVVKQSRDAMGYSIDSLTSGLTGAEIVRVELGADVDPAMLRRIAAALQVPSATFGLT